MLPDLLSDFSRRALLCRLADVRAGHVPLRDVNGENAADRPVAVPVPECPAFGPELRLRNRRQGPGSIRVERVSAPRVQILGSTPHPDETFMCQIVRNLTLGDTDQCRGLICDRYAKWSRAVRARLQDAGIRVVQTPYRAPNANAYAERFVRSTKEECLNRLIPCGERHHRRAIAEFVAHYHRERNHQGLDNELIESEPAAGRVGRVRRHQRLGGLLNYYARAA